jgi:hypothetical protein
MIARVPHKTPIAALFIVVATIALFLPTDVVGIHVRIPFALVAFMVAAVLAVADDEHVAAMRPSLRPGAPRRRRRRGSGEGAHIREDRPGWR